MGRINLLIIRLLTLITIFVCFGNGYLFAQNSAQDKLEELERQIINFQEKQEHVKLAQTFSKAALILVQLKQSQKAIDYYKQSASLYLQNKKLNDTRKVYSNIGFIYADDGDLQNARTYFQKATKVANLQKDKEAIACSLADEAYIETHLKEYQNSIDHLLEALKLAQEVNNQQLIVKIYAMLMDNYKKMGLTAKFQEYQAKFNSLLINKEKEQAHQEIEAKRQEANAKILDKELELKTLELEQKLAQAEFDKQQAIQQEKLYVSEMKERLEQIERMKAEREREVQKQQTTRREKDYAQMRELKESGDRFTRLLIWGGSLFLLLLIIIIALIAYNAHRNKKYSNKLIEKNKIIELKNQQVQAQSRELTNVVNELYLQKKDTEDSINYARNIQFSLLVGEEKIKEHIPDSFLFFHPKDIVSGDFYWFARIKKFINGVEHDKIFIGAIDCTGHGVPGAMLSMIGYRILDHVVYDMNVFHPNEIMNHLHLQVRAALRQDETGNHDGMDMALCLIDKIENRVEYAGAKNGLLYQNAQGEFLKVKANSFGIGGLATEEGPRQFTNNIIPIVEGKQQSFYIFSDGYSDQFGYINHRKYMSGKFRKLLEQVAKSPIEKQKDLLELEFEEWKGAEAQTDDCLVIGFKI